MRLLTGVRKRYAHVDILLLDRLLNSRNLHNHLLLRVQLLLLLQLLNKWRDLVARLLACLVTEQAHRVQKNVWCLLSRIHLLAWRLDHIDHLAIRLLMCDQLLLAYLLDELTGTNA